jgi:hypothetical protein
MKKLFTLFAVAAMAFVAQANVLTVCDDEYASEAIPVYGYWFDAPGMTQQIYPADMLTEMNGGKITEVKFFSPAGAWGEDYADYYIEFSDGVVTLAIKEVDELGFADDPVAITGAQVVSTTTPNEGDTELTFTFNEPYTYNGGNLLIEVSWEGEGEYSYYGTYFIGASEFGYNASFLQYGLYGSLYAADFLPMAAFTYEPGEVTPPTPPTPTEMTAAPTFNGYTEDGIHAYFVEINETEPSTIYYRVQSPDGEWTEWAEYTEVLAFTGNGKYRVEAYAVAPDKAPSTEIAYEFVVSPFTGIEEMNADKQVANVRYFNMAGQEMQQANGLTIMVTTYTDGTTSAVKVVK